MIEEYKITTLTSGYLVEHQGASYAYNQSYEVSKKILGDLEEKIKAGVGESVVVTLEVIKQKG